MRCIAVGTDALLVEVADVAEAAAVYSEARRRGIDAVDIVPAARTVQFSGVPAGSVGLAGAFTGVYPSASPGGWQLIGRTDLTLRDVDRDDPATLSPGTRVRFVDVGR